MISRAGQPLHDQRQPNAAFAGLQGGTLSEAVTAHLGSPVPQMTGTGR